MSHSINTLFFKLFKRNLQKDYSVITLNLSGLSIGICVSLLIYLWVVDELSYDKFHVDYNNIYRVVQVDSKDNSLRKNILTDMPLAAALKDNFPQIQSAVGISCNNGAKDFIIDNNYFTLDIDYTSEDFFDVFSFPVITKADSAYFPNNRSVVLTKKCAKKLFGTTDCLGKHITMSFYGKKELIVSAIIEVPDNSHLQFEVILPYASSETMLKYISKWGTIKTMTYIRFKKKKSITRNTYEGMSHFLFDHRDEKILLSFQPLKDIHLYTKFIDRFSSNNGDILYVRIFIVSMILLLILSNLNFIILTAARSEKRRKEIAVKKLYGASKNIVVIQFISEIVIKTTIAYLIAVLLSYLILPLFNLVIGKELIITFDLSLFLFFIGSLILSILISSLYMSAYLAHFKPLDLLSGTKAKALKQNLSNYITPFQLFISTFFILCFFTIFSQLKYMQNKEKGIDLSNIIVFKTQGFIYSYENVKQDLLSNPGIISVTAAGIPPVNYESRAFKVELENGTEAGFVFYMTDASFAKTFDLKLLEGGFLSEDLNQDSYFNREYLSNNPVVINESARKVLSNIQLGQKLSSTGPLSSFHLAGVVEDFHLQPLKQKIEPLIMSYNPEVFNEAYVKIHPERKEEMLEFIKQVTAKYRKGEYAFNYYFLEDKIDAQYKSEINMVNMALMIMLISVIISLFGLFSLAWYSLIRQKKTISIRKVFGAEPSQIITLFIKRTVLMTSLSFIVAATFSAYFLHLWLENYTYRIGIPVYVFILSYLSLILLISFITYLISRKESTRNPVDNLRYE